jgi:hypothetical protein
MLLRVLRQSLVEPSESYILNSMVFFMSVCPKTSSTRLSI